MVITVTVKCPQEVKVTISFEEDQTVLQLKEQLAKELDSTTVPTPSNQQRLIYSGRILKDEELLSVYKIQDGNTLHMVKGAAPKSTPTTNTTSTNTTPSVAGVPSPNAFVNPFPSGAGGLGSHPFAAFGGADPMGAMDPNVMATILQNPQVSSSISQLMANPQLIDHMINSNPQLAAMMTPEMRAMMSSPDFARMMTDPNIVRQAMAMAPLLQAMGGPGAMGANPLAPFPAAGTNNANSTRDTAVPPVAATPTPAAPGGLPSFGPSPALLQMLMGGGPFGAQAAATVGRPPEEIYEVQLRQLQEMGFFSAAENVRALSMSGGNVDAAVEWLLSHPTGNR